MTADNASTHMPRNRCGSCSQHERIAALKAEAERLRDGIRKHRDDINNNGPTGEPAATIDARLWALLDDRTETT